MILFELNRRCKMKDIFSEIVHFWRFCSSLFTKGEIKDDLEIWLSQMKSLSIHLSHLDLYNTFYTVRTKEIRTFYYAWRQIYCNITQVNNLHQHVLVRHETRILVIIQKDKAVQSWRQIFNAMRCFSVGWELSMRWPFVIW